MSVSTAVTGSEPGVSFALRSPWLARLGGTLIWGALGSYLAWEALTGSPIRWFRSYDPSLVLTVFCAGAGILLLAAARSLALLITLSLRPEGALVLQNDHLLIPQLYNMKEAELVPLSAICYCKVVWRPRESALKIKHSRGKALFGRSLFLEPDDLERACEMIQSRLQVARPPDIRARRRMPGLFSC